MVKLPGFAQAIPCLFFAASLFAHPPSKDAADDQSGRKITIWMYNYAQVPAALVTKAQVEMTRIFAEMGVGTRWLTCPVQETKGQETTECQGRMLATDLAILLLHRVTLPVRTTPHGTLGSADVFTNGQFGHYVRLSCDNILDPRDFEGEEAANILAAAALHETGHLLLNSTDHSSIGVMRAKWDREDFRNASMGRLLFTASQAELIRKQVEARASQAQPERAQSREISVQTLPPVMEGSQP